MKIDFVCPVKIDTYNRKVLLDQTINSLLRNTPKENINRIILIDDMSTYPLEYDGVTILRNSHQLGVGGSKNRGVAKHSILGRGDALYIFDGDVYFCEGWSTEMIGAYYLYKEQFLIIAGGVHPFLQPREGEDNEHLTSHDAISGWSWLLGYDVWDKYGILPDNAVGVGKSEDTAFCLKIRDDGYLVGCLKNQLIAHVGLTDSEGKDIVGRDISEILARHVAPEAILL